MRLLAASLLCGMKLVETYKMRSEFGGMRPGNSLSQNQSSRLSSLWHSNILVAVGEIARNVQARLLAELHLHNALVPAWIYVSKLTSPGCCSYIPLMTRPTPIGVWKLPRPVVESNCLPFSSGWPGVRSHPVYSMVTRSPFCGLGPLPSEMTVFWTPIVDAVELRVRMVVGATCRSGREKFVKGRSIGSTEVAESKAWWGNWVGGSLHSRDCCCKGMQNAACGLESRASGTIFTAWGRWADPLW